MHRQALRRAVVSALRQNRLASLLVVLLIGTVLLGTPTFGGSLEEGREEAYHQLSESLRRMWESDCIRLGTLCEDVDRRVREVLRCLRKPESCGANDEPPKAPEPVSQKAPEPLICPDGSILICVPEQALEDLLKGTKNPDDPVKVAECVNTRAKVLWDCVQKCDVTASQDLVKEAKEVWKEGATGAGVGAAACRKRWPKFMVLCTAGGYAVGGILGHILAENPCDRLCWFDFKNRLREECPRPTKSAWRGEGTFQFDFEHKGPQFHHQQRMDGPFAMTLVVQEDGTIQGEGTATLTLATEWLVDGEGPGQCTANGRDTVPLSVSGMHEDGKLKLRFASSPEAYHVTASCSGGIAPSIAWFSSRKFVELTFDIYFDQDQPLVVAAEAGAEEQLVEDIVSPPAADGDTPGIWRRIYSIRLKALPPEEEGSRPVSGGPGQSAPELSGPLLSDH